MPDLRSFDPVGFSYDNFLIYYFLVSVTHAMLFFLNAKKNNPNNKRKIPTTETRGCRSLSGHLSYLYCNMTQKSCVDDYFETI